MLLIDLDVKTPADSWPRDEPIIRLGSKGTLPWRCDICVMTHFKSSEVVFYQSDEVTVFSGNFQCLFVMLRANPQD